MTTQKAQQKPLTPTKRKRNKMNKNIILHEGSTFEGHSVITNKGPLSEHCLQKIYDVVNSALDEHARIFAVRFDLRLPINTGNHDSSIISIFIDLLKRRITSSRSTGNQQGSYLHQTSVKYVWVKEYSENIQPHYHVVLLLNHDAYNTIGTYSIKNNNLYTRICKAWATALGVDAQTNTGLVHIPHNAQYRLIKGDTQSFSNLFHRLSYLCKTETKVYGSNKHQFGSSNI